MPDAADYYQAELEEISEAKQKVEDKVWKLMTKLHKPEHAKFAFKALRNPIFPNHFENQKTWVMYWLINTCNMLNHGADRPDAWLPLKVKIISFLARFQSPTGGFAGSVGYQPHHATSFASILAICLLNNRDAYDIVNRKTMKEYLLRTRSKTTIGCQHIQEDGEVDLRANYITLVIATLLNICDEDITSGMPEYIATCQTYEGGLAPFPYAEAHAGYTYCGVAALAILGRLDAINIPKLLEWLINKQCDLEGGFRGRTGKVVDSCYSHWLGACFSILNKYKKSEDGKFMFNFDNSLLFDQEGLQKYVLWACQDKSGGLMDKPGKHVDYYHMNYSLLGFNLSTRCDVSDSDGGFNEICTVFGSNDDNLLVDVDPVYAVPMNRFVNMKSHFDDLGPL